MKDLTKIGNECLQHENSIVSSVAHLEDVLVNAIESNDIEEFRLIIPALNTVIEDAQKYKNFLLRL